jgi:DNA-directed RNA polymerase alpha subunit
MDSYFFTSLETRLENRRNFYGRFQLGPFDSGQGLTIANAFRRTLLSECTGLGIIVVELEGASHEYATLPGVQESVLEILLNLKQIVLTKDRVAQNSAETPRQSSKLNNIKLNKNIQTLKGRLRLSLREDIKNLSFPKGIQATNKSKQNSIHIEDGPFGFVNGVNQKLKNKFVFPSGSSDLSSLRDQVTSKSKQKQETIWSKIGYLRVEGPKIVRARDIKLPEPLQCVDPNQYLATLTYDGKLNIKLLVCQGKNSIIHNLLPTHFNQSWFFHSPWFYPHKLAPNPMTVLLLKDRNTNSQEPATPCPKGPTLSCSQEPATPCNLPTNPKDSKEPAPPIPSGRPATPCSEGALKIKLSNKHLFSGWQQRKKALKKFVTSDKQKNVQPQKGRPDISFTNSKEPATPILGLPKVDQSFRPSGRPAPPILGLPKVDQSFRPSGRPAPPWSKTVPGGWNSIPIRRYKKETNPKKPATPCSTDSKDSQEPALPWPATPCKQRSVSIFELTSAVQNLYDQKQSTFDENLLIWPNNPNNPKGSTTPKAGSDLSTQLFTQSKDKTNPFAPATPYTTKPFLALSENSQKPATDSLLGIKPFFPPRVSQQPAETQPVAEQPRTTTNPTGPTKSWSAPSPGTTTTSAPQGSDPVVSPPVAEQPAASLPAQESLPLALGRLALTRSKPLIVDSVFLPVQKVNYTVEFDNTFDRTKERVILEIWTNGSMHPRKALSLAAKRLLRVFYTFVKN